MKEVFSMFFILNSLKSCNSTVLMKVIIFARMSKLSINNAMIIRVDLLKKTQLSSTIGSNFIDFKFFFALLFHSQPDCLG